MSQTPPQEPVVTDPTPETQSPEDFLQAQNAAKRHLVEKGRGAGFAYSPHGNPAIIYHQLFEAGIEPSGSCECSKALAVGSTGGALSVVLVAAPDTEDAVTAAAGATITASFLQGDSPEGEFEEVGPTICVTAPTGGMSAEAGGLLCRFHPGNFAKGWLKVNLEFSGTISGGNLDCALSYAPH